MYCQPFVLQGFGDNIAGESLFPLQVCHALVPLLSAAPFCVCKIYTLLLLWFFVKLCIDQNVYFLYMHLLKCEEMLVAYRLL
jgi:hypothetical protein